MSDNMQDLRKLRTAVEAKCQELHLNLVHFAVTPGKDANDTDILNVAMLVTAEAVETIEETETRTTNDEFEALFAANFGDIDDFASDETKELLAKEEADRAARVASLEAAMRELDDD